MKNFMRRFITSTFLLIFLLVQFLTALPKPVFAAVPYTASDVLGQADFISAGSNALGPSPVLSSGTTSMSSPQDTAIDSVNHRLFVLETASNRVLVYNLDSNNLPLDRIADNVLGQENFSSTGSDTTAQGFSGPKGLDFDSTNNRLFVADTGNNRVLIFDTNTIENNEDAIYVLGQANFTSLDGGDVLSGFSIPYEVAVDSIHNRLFVTDWGYGRVIVFNISSLSNGMNSTYSLEGGGGPNQASVYYPEGLAYDPVQNRLFATDQYSNRVLVFDVSAIVSGENAVYVLGQPDFVTGSGDTEVKGFMAPQKLTFDSVANRLYVADTNNHRIMVFDTASISNNEDAQYVLGQADFTSLSIDTNAQGFNAPTGLTIDPTNSRLYVADTGNNRVLIFSTDSINNNEDAVALLGADDYTFSGGGDQNAFGLNYPYAPVIDNSRHRLYIADASNYRVLVFNLDINNNLIDKTADYVLGQSSFVTGNSSGSAEQNILGYMYGGLAVDEESGYLYVADYDYSRVMIFDTNNLSNGMNASYVLGQVDFESNDRTNGINGLQYPWTGIAVDTVNNLVFVGDVYNNRIMVFDTANLSNGMDASYVLGQPDFDTYTGATSQSGLSSPSGGVIYDPVNRRLFVADTSNSRVLVYNLSNGISNGMNASYVLGQPDFESSIANTSQDTLNYPDGLAYDSNQQMLFVQDNSNRILVFDISAITNGEPAIAVIGQSDFISNDDLGVSQSSVNNSYDNLWFDSQNRKLYSADDGNNRVLIFDFAHLKDLPSTLSTNNSVNETLGEGYQGTTTYTLDSGTLPTGLSFNTQTGVLSGTPTSEGTYTFTITITDDNGVVGTYTDTKNYTLTIISPVTKPEGEYSTTEAPRCTDQVASAPDLFQVDRSYNAATVHFTPLSDNVSSYLISYGTDSTAEGYSVELPISHSDGVVSQTINELNPSSSYSFKVRAQKGCMPGDWSNVKKDTISTHTDTLTSQVFTPSNQGSNITTSPSKASSKKKVVKKSTKQTKKIMKPKSTPRPKPTKPWYMFWSR